MQIVEESLTSLDIAAQAQSCKLQKGNHLGNSLAQHLSKSDMMFLPLLHTIGTVGLFITVWSAMWPVGLLFDFIDFISSAQCLKFCSFFCSDLFDVATVNTLT